jgi:hypothetical protein
MSASLQKRPGDRSIVVPIVMALIEFRANDPESVPPAR